MATTEQSPLERVLAELERLGYGPIKRNGKEHRCRCPAHGDDTPSLDVAEKNGRVVFQCRSQGCSFSSIMRALKLSEAAGFPANGRAKEMPFFDRIVATYDYRDEEGRLLFQCVRLFPKDFRQRQPKNPYMEGAGWDWTLNGARLVPYCLPELLKAPVDAIVFVVEGEKDVDALAKCGLTATTSPMGAGKWHKLDSSSLEVFRGRTVIVLPDNDEAGRKHADDVVQSLRLIAAEIAILKLSGLPEKGDVSDWLANGGTAEDLLRLAVDAPRIGDAWERDTGKESHDEREATPGEQSSGDKQQSGVWRPNPIDSKTFANGDYRHDWLAKKMLVMREPVIVFGPSKALKTSLVIDLCISLATGTRALGFFEVPHPRRVLIISGESGPASLQSVARRVCAAKGIDLADIGAMLQWEFSLPPLSDPRALIILRELLAKNRIENAIVDPAYLALLTGGNASADSASNLFAMGPLLGGLVDACTSAGSQLVLIHHTNARIEVGHEPELRHIAYSGFQQFARQWIGINRLEPYDHSGRSKLVIVAGGSAGHGGKWVAAIDEGVMDENFSGKRWDVSLEPFIESVARDRAEKKSAKEEKKEADLLANLLKVENAIRDLCAKMPERAATKTKIREQLDFNSDKTGRLIGRLELEKRIEAREILIASGPTGKTMKPAIGYVIAGTPDDLFAKPDTAAHESTPGTM